MKKVLVVPTIAQEQTILLIARTRNIAMSLGDLRKPLLPKLSKYNMHVAGNCKRPEA